MTQAVILTPRLTAVEGCSRLRNTVGGEGEGGKGGRGEKPEWFL